MDEAKGSIYWLESVAPTIEVSLVLKWAQACIEKLLSPYLVSKSPFNCEMGSLRGEIKCLDTQRARKANFSDSKEFSECCSDGSCQAFSQVKLVAPMLDEVEDTETLDLDSMLWGGPGVFKCPEISNRDNRHEEH